MEKESNNKQANKRKKGKAVSGLACLPFFVCSVALSKANKLKPQCLFSARNNILPQLHFALQVCTSNIPPRDFGVRVAVGAFSGPVEKSPLNESTAESRMCEPKSRRWVCRSSGTNNMQLPISFTVRGGFRG